MVVERGSFIRFLFEDGVEGVVLSVNEQTEPPLLKVMAVYDDGFSYSITTEDDVEKIERSQISDLRLQIIDKEFPKGIQYRV